MRDHVTKGECVMAGVKDHWNQNIADDPLGRGSRTPGRISSTSSAGDAAGPMTSAGASGVEAVVSRIADGSGVGAVAARKYLDQNKTKSTNEIQGVNRKK